MKTLTAALALIAAIAAVAELAARADVVAGALPPPSYGTRIRMFDWQMARLRARAADGGVDCAFVGSSAVLHALNPEIFATDLTAATGSRVRCFNFGLAGASLADVRSLAPILVRDYGVRLVVYGATDRDFSVDAGGLQLPQHPWVRRRTVAWNLDGFLTDSSHAFRYVLLARRWLDEYRAEPYRGLTIRADGHMGATRAFRTDEPLTGWTLEVAEQGRVFDARLLSGLLDLGRSGVNVVIAELPVSPHTIAQLEAQGREFYHPGYFAFRSVLEQRARRPGVVFVGAPGTGVVPDDGWADYVHMNVGGSAPYTRWLAARVVDAATSGRLALDRPAQPSVE